MLQQLLRDSEARNAELLGKIATLVDEVQSLHHKQQSLHHSFESLEQKLQVSRESESQAAKELAALAHDYEALSSTQVITSNRDALQERVAELEAANQRFVDMLWGQQRAARSSLPTRSTSTFRRVLSNRRSPRSVGSDHRPDEGGRGIRPRTARVAQGSS